MRIKSMDEMHFRKPLFFFLHSYLDLLDEESKSDDLEDSKADDTEAESEEGVHDSLSNLRIFG